LNVAKRSKAQRRKTPRNAAERNLALRRGAEHRYQHIADGLQFALSGLFCQETSETKIMDRAIRAAVDKAGGWRPLARELGIKAQSLQNWRRIPPTRVLQIEKITGLPRTFLRPDIYPKDGR
jgi:hypothetical protein